MQCCQVTTDTSNSRKWRSRCPGLVFNVLRWCCVETRCQRRHGNRHLRLRPLRHLHGSDGNGSVLVQHGDDRDLASVFRTYATCLSDWLEFDRSPSVAVMLPRSFRILYDCKHWKASFRSCCRKLSYRKFAFESEYTLECKLCSVYAALVNICHWIY